MTENLTIEDLEKHSGLSIRTLRYYMSIGLLPGADTLGKYASYSQEHLDRLDLILILKEMHIPLDEIRVVLDQLTPEEICHYRDEQGDLLEKIKAFKPQADDRAQTPGKGSALDYIKNLEEAHSVHETLAENSSSYLYKNEPPSFLQSESPSLRSEEQGREPRHEKWRRFILSDGVEVHVRETRNRETRNKIDRLLSFARSLFSK